MVAASYLRNSVDNGAKFSDLPPELLRLISTKLTNISDYVRFRSVCSGWRSAANQPPQLPLLLLPLRSSAAAAASILNLSDGKLYTSGIPDPRRSSLISSFSDGYLVELSLDEPAPTATLVNLLTGSQTHVTIPPLPLAMRPPYVTKAVLTAKRDDVIIAILAPERNMFAFCKMCSESCKSEMKWEVAELGDPYCSEDFLYHDGAFYFTNGTVAVAVEADSSPPTMTTLDRPSFSWPCRSCHLVESSGDVLLVARSAYSARRFEVFRFDKSGKPKWSRVERGRMGDRALFLSAKRSVSVSSSSSGWRGNCVYYADEDYLVARIRSFDIDEEEEGEDKPYSWVAPSSHWTNSLDSSGVTWFLPSFV